MYLIYLNSLNAIMQSYLNELEIKYTEDNVFLLDICASCLWLVDDFTNTVSVRKSYFIEIYSL